MVIVLNFFNKLFGNNKEETPDEKNGVLSVSKKAILKKVPLRWKLIAIYVAASIFGIMILVIGHTLNMVLGLLSVVVHGVRLNVMEFSSQCGIEWAGIEYHPFR